MIISTRKKRERLKPVGQRIWDPHDDRLTSGPAWRVVKFWKTYPNMGDVLLTTFVYETLEQANNGRIIARAFNNYTKELRGYKRPSWAGFARRIDFVHYPKDGKPRESLGDAVSAKIYGCITRGTLPKDDAARQRIFDLAGYPWE